MAEIIKDGCVMPTMVDVKAPSVIEVLKDEKVKKKRRRAKYKRHVSKPFMKVSWQERRKNDKSKKSNRFRKLVPAKTNAPFNNNQFLMEIHKPEPENNFHILHTPTARTRDSSFSVDSEENYFFSLPEDEEEYLTKEFSSVYEDAQSERLSDMSKSDLIQEYLLLEVKYENLLKRTERNKLRYNEDDKDMVTENESFVSDKDGLNSDRNASGTSLESNLPDGQSISDILQLMKNQENQIKELQLANDQLRYELKHFHERSHESTSEDSESDSSTTSVSSGSSSRSETPVFAEKVDNALIHNVNREQSMVTEENFPQTNGYHNTDDSTDSVINNGPLNVDN